MYYFLNDSKMMSSMKFTMFWLPSHGGGGQAPIYILLTLRPPQPKQRPYRSLNDATHTPPQAPPM